MTAIENRPDSFDDIRKAVRRRFGENARIDAIVQPTLGGSNRTVVFDLIENNARRRLVSRQETYSAEDSPFLSPSDQFKVMAAAYRHGLPVPEAVFEYDEQDGMGHGFVTGFVAGETIPKKIIADPAFADARGKLPAQLGEFEARLNAIPLEEVAFLEHIPDSADPIQAQRARYDFYGEPHPGIELGLRWLETHRPPQGKRTLIHGDFRNGNFMVGPDGLARCSIGSAAISAAGWKISAGSAPGPGASAAKTFRLEDSPNARPCSTASRRPAANRSIPTSCATGRFSGWCAGASSISCRRTAMCSADGAAPSSRHADAIPARSNTIY